MRPWLARKPLVQAANLLLELAYLVLDLRQGHKLGGHGGEDIFCLLKALAQHPGLIGRLLHLLLQLVHQGLG